MSRLNWSDTSNRFYEDGIDRGVLYPISGVGVAWTGLVSVEETVVGGDQTPLYYDGTKYLDVIGNEDFQASLTAISAPPEFSACDGTLMLAPGLFATQQPRQPFGFSYRTRLANVGQGVRYGYKLHIVYNATASPSGRVSKTLSDSPEPESRTWVLNTVPAESGTLLIKPTAHLIIDSTKSNPTALAAVEGLLYGTDNAAPQMPSQSQFATLLSS